MIKLNAQLIGVLEFFSFGMVIAQVSAKHEIITYMSVIQNKNGIDIAKPSAVAMAKQRALWAKLSSLTNTIANGNTAGFQSVVYKTDGSPAKNTEGIVSFVKVASTIRNVSDGSFHTTGNPFDVALSGGGANYFSVSTNNGVRWTRNGQLKKDPEGVLRTGAGNFKVLDSGGGEIVIPKNANSVKIGQQGSIYADGQFIAKLGVSHFKNPQELVSEGYNLLNTSEAPEAAEKFDILQGGYEDSNTSPVEASIELIKVMRTYEAAEKIIKTYGKAHREAINIKAT